MKYQFITGGLIALATAQNNNGNNDQRGINPNSDATFDPNTNQGNMGTFTVSTAAVASATGGPTQVDEATKQAMQLAILNWRSDTTLVSQFQNQARNVQDDAQFKSIADGAFKAEVDELSQKAVLDQVIGNDPRVSIANQTLTNGCFQMVVDNLQIMSKQGMTKSNLVDTIDAARCNQVLPSIDTYMVVAAEYIGNAAFQSRASRPDACNGPNGVVQKNANDPNQNPPVPVCIIVLSCQ